MLRPRTPPPAVLRGSKSPAPLLIRADCVALLRNNLTPMLKGAAALSPTCETRTLLCVHPRKSRPK